MEAKSSKLRSSSHLCSQFSCFHQLWIIAQHLRQKTWFRVHVKPYKNANGATKSYPFLPIPHPCRNRQLGLIMFKQATEQCYFLSLHSTIKCKSQIENSVFNISPLTYQLYQYLQFLNQGNLFFTPSVPKQMTQLYTKVSTKLGHLFWNGGSIKHGLSSRLSTHFNLPCHVAT